VIVAEKGANAQAGSGFHFLPAPLVEGASGAYGILLPARTDPGAPPGRGEGFADEVPSKQHLLAPNHG